MEKLTLAVPYAEKDHVKALGARWDNQLKRWYVPAGLSREPFAPWLQPQPQNLPEIHVSAPLFLLSSNTPCWQCQRETPIYGLLSKRLSHSEGVKTGALILSQVSELPRSLVRQLSVLACTYSYDYSTVDDASYYLNHCLCGAKLADFLLHETRGKAFYPMDAAQASNITRLDLSLDKNVVVKAKWHHRPLVMRHAKTTFF